jgi:hypothetical protein
VTELGVAVAPELLADGVLVLACPFALLLCEYPCCEGVLGGGELRFCILVASAAVLDGLSLPLGVNALFPVLPFMLLLLLDACALLQPPWVLLLDALIVGSSRLCWRSRTWNAPPCPLADEEDEGRGCVRVWYGLWRCGCCILFMLALLACDGYAPLSV